MKIKYIIYQLFFYIGRIIGIFYAPFNLVSNAFTSLYYRIYSGYQSRKFNGFGVNSLLAPANYLNGLQYISIGDNVVIAKGVILTAWYCGNEPHIYIGNGTRFGEHAHITCINSIIIGKNVLTGRNVLITDNSHGNNSHMYQGIPPIDRPMFSKGDVIIEDNVWIGENVSILPGVHIGANSIIGANTVVTKSVPCNSIVVGTGMRILKY